MLLDDVRGFLVWGCFEFLMGGSRFVEVNGDILCQILTILFVPSTLLEIST